MTRKTSVSAEASATPNKADTGKHEKSEKKTEGKPDKTVEIMKGKSSAESATMNTSVNEGNKELEPSKVEIGAELTKFKDELRAMFAGMLSKSEERMSKQISVLETKFMASVEGLRKDLTVEMTEMRVEMEGTKGEIKTVRESMQRATSSVKAVTEKVSEIEKSLEFQSGQIKDMDKTCDNKIREVTANLNEKIRELSNGMLIREKQERKYNLLFYGFPEEADEDVFDILKESFITELHLNEDRVRNMYFTNGHRIPSKAVGPKPIILRFSSFEDRELVLSNASNYAGKRKRVLVDWPAEMKQERSRLAKKAYDIRKSEEIQTRIRDKGLDVFLEVRKDNNERWQKRAV